MAGTAAAQDQTVNFHIDAQPMDKALNALSEQSGVRVLYPYDQVVGLQSKAVNGRMPARAALQRLIDHAPLKISLVQTGLIALSSVSSKSTSLLKVSSTTVVATSPTPVAAAAASLAAGQPETPGTAEAPPAKEAEPPSEVIVTGVRGHPRTVVDSPTPVDVLSAGELERTGRPGVLQALETLVPSFNLPARAGGGTATVISTGGLRGLNPDQTLILVDGKRRHKTALINAVSSLYNGSVPADLDLIPEAGIGRIEVLRDGAAAQYGSDAIAGVINIILKDTEGGLISGTTGQNFDRGDGQFLTTSASYGAKVGDKGFLTVFFNGRDQAISNRANAVPASTQLYPKIGGLPDPREATADRLITKNYGQLPQASDEIGFNGHYDLDNGVRLYAFGTYAYRDTDLPYTFRSANSVNALPQVYPNGFRPNLDIFENDFQFVEGAKGVWRGWSWDLSTSYGLDNAREHLDQSINASLGPSSPTSFYVGTLDSTEWDNTLDVTRDFKLDMLGDIQVSFGLEHRRETYELDAGDPASHAAGTYVIPAGAPFAGQRPQTGAQAVPGIQPSDASDHSRNNYAAYAEVGWTPIKKLFLDGAVRYEDYDDSSGDAVIGKFDARYELTDWLALRGAVSNGFRAPALAQEYYSSTSSQFRLVNNALDLLLIKTLPVDSPQAKALGAQPLQPETSRNYSVGVTMTPLHNLNVTVDAYQIDVDKRIALTGTLTGSAVSSILVANGLSGDLSAQYYTNAINTRTQGIDLVATYRQDLWEYGSIRWSLGANYNTTDITHIKANPPQLAALGPSYVLFDRMSQGYLTTALPKTKVALGGNYTVRNWEVTLHETRYGGYNILQDTPSSDRSFGPKWITDLEVAYHVNKSVTLALGANNIGNVYPSSNGIYNTTVGSGQYPSTSPFGFTGGSYYARVQWNF
jgi:iron complex outermembrane receptor protein